MIVLDFFHRLNLYDAESGLTSLLLPGSIVDPQHAIQTTSGNFYVSQGWKTGQAHQISKLDATAQNILSQFGSDLPGNKYTGTQLASSFGF
jgi:hypothetical protein